MKLNNKSIKIILLLLIFISLSLGIAYASGAFLGGSNEVSLTKGLVGHWKLDEETYDEYTVNLAPFTNYSNRNYNTAYSASCWGGDLATIYHYSEGGYNNLPYKKMIKTTGGSGGCYHDNHYGIQIEDNKVYTISAWMKSNISVTVNGYALDINRASDNTYRTGPSISLTTEWKRYSWTYTSGTGHAGIYQARNIIYVDDNLPFEIYWSGFQVEEKPYTTPYVSGIRQSKVTDSTPSENHGITNTGLNTPSFTTDRFGKENGALEFDGLSDSIQINQPISFDEGYNYFTITGWIYPLSSGGWLVCPNSNGIDNYISYSNGRIGVTVVEFSDTNSNSVYSSTDSAPLNQWSHFAISINNLNVKLYVNGVFEGGIERTIPIGLWSNYWSIGKRPNGQFPFNGSISDIRVYNRILSEEEIKLLYDSYKPQTTVASLNRGLVLDMPLTSTWTKSETLGSEVITDKTPYSNDGQNYGSILGLDSISLDGVDDYVSIPNSSPLHGEVFGLTNTFTISTWAYPKAWTYWATIINKANGASWSNTLNGLWASTDYGFRCVMGSGVGGNPAGSSIGPGYNPGLNNWHHIVCIADGVNLKIYVNGIYRGESAISGLTYPRVNNNEPITIGRRSVSSGPSFNGNISNIKTYNRALSEEEIKLLYDQGRNNFGSILSHPKSCKEILDLGLSKGDGIYTIRPDLNQEPFEVYCDMTTDGGGWTLYAYTTNYNDLSYPPSMFTEYGSYNASSMIGNAVLGSKFLENVDVYDFLVTDLNGNQPYVPGGELVYVNNYVNGKKSPWGCLLSHPCGINCGSAKSSGLDLRGYAINGGSQEWASNNICSSTYAHNQWSLGYSGGDWLNSDLGGIYLEYWNGGTPSSARRSAMILGNHNVGITHKVWLR